MKNIQKYGFKQGLPQEFEVIDISLLFKSFSKAMTSPHRAEFYQVIWFQEGYPTHIVDFKPLRIKPNTLVFINKGAVQQFDSNKNYTGKSILFTDSFFCQSQLDTKYLKHTILFNNLFSTSDVSISSGTEMFKDLFTQIQAELLKPKDQYQSDILRNMLRTLLLQAERIKKQQTQTPIPKGIDLDNVIQFRNLLEEQFQNHKQVSYYTEQLAFTKKRLNQSTSKILGVTPKQMIDARVILEAKRQLAHTNESVKEIGFNLGFEEPTNFVKYFKKHVLVTPLEFKSEFTF